MQGTWQGRVVDATEMRWAQQLGAAHGPASSAGQGKAQRQGARPHVGAARAAPVPGAGGRCDNAGFAGAGGGGKCEERPRAITLGVGCVHLPTVGPDRPAGCLAHAGCHPSPRRRLSPCPPRRPPCRPYTPGAACCLRPPACPWHRSRRRGARRRSRRTKGAAARQRIPCSSPACLAPPHLGSGAACS